MGILNSRCDERFRLDHLVLFNAEVLNSEEDHLNLLNSRTFRHIWPNFVLYLAHQREDHFLAPHPGSSARIV
jgi:hypothetical protein